jgi:hypothetical protein
MFELKEVVPELISLILSLILSFLGVPSIIEIGIRTISIINNVLPYYMNTYYIIMLNILGWFITAEPILRILAYLRRREYF